MNDPIVETKTNGVPSQVLAMYEALANAQGEFPPIPKNREVFIKTEKGSYKFRYADLEIILSSTRPAMSKYGLALIQPITSEGPQCFLDTIITHKDGGQILARVNTPSPMDMMSDPKRYGAFMTYLRRYCASAALGVAADDDLDSDHNDSEKKDEQNNSKTQETRFPTAPITPTSGALASLTPAQLNKVTDVAISIIDLLTEGREYDAFEALEGSGLDADEKVALWKKLDSKQRASIKSQAAKAKEPA